MSDDERDALLLRLEASVNSLTVYVKAMATKLLSPTEIADIEAQVSESQTVAAD